MTWGYMDLMRDVFLSKASKKNINSNNNNFMLLLEL